MKTISEQLVEESNGLLKIVPEISDSTSRYMMHNDAGVEVEVGELLFSLVRVTKPSFVLETGTHVGVGAAYLAAGCRANGFGEVTTLEFIEEHFIAARALLSELLLIGKSGWVRPTWMHAMNYRPMEEIDILFLDTEPQTRFAELMKFYPAVATGGLILIHDLHSHMGQIPNTEHGDNWPFGSIPPEMTDLVRRDALRPVHFHTPRGLTMFYKTAIGDYIWH